MKIDRIIEHLESHEEDRPIVRKNKINREFLEAMYPNLKWLGSSESIEKMIADCLDIDRKIRRAKQLHPHLAGDEEEVKQELEEHAREDLGYTITP